MAVPCIPGNAPLTAIRSTVMAAILSSFTRMGVCEAWQECANKEENN